MKKKATTYTLVHELMASPTAPMPEAKTRHQLLRMHSGLESIERGEHPSADDWRVLSDAVNLMETLIEMGEVQDPERLHYDAMAALAHAGKRAINGNALRLDAAGMQSVRALLENYAECLKALPERTMVRCHRLTERRLRQIMAGIKRPHDVELIAV